MLRSEARQFGVSPSWPEDPPHDLSVRVREPKKSLCWGAEETAALRHLVKARLAKSSKGEARERDEAKQAQAGPSPAEDGHSGGQTGEEERRALGDHAVAGRRKADKRDTGAESGQSPNGREDSSGNSRGSRRAKNLPSNPDTDLVVENRGLRLVGPTANGPVTALDAQTTAPPRASSRGKYSPQQSRQQAMTGPSFSFPDPGLRDATSLRPHSSNEAGKRRWDSVGEASQDAPAPAAPGAEEGTRSPKNARSAGSERGLAFGFGGDTLGLSGLLDGIGQARQSPTSLSPTSLEDLRAYPAHLAGASGLATGLGAAGSSPPFEHFVPRATSGPSQPAASQAPLFTSLSLPTNFILESFSGLLAEALAKTGASADFSPLSSPLSDSVPLPEVGQLPGSFSPFQAGILDQLSNFWEAETSSASPLVPPVPADIASTMTLLTSGGALPCDPPFPLADSGDDSLTAVVRGHILRSASDTSFEMVQLGSIGGGLGGRVSAGLPIADVWSPVQTSARQPTNVSMTAGSLSDCRSISLSAGPASPEPSSFEAALAGSALPQATSDPAGATKSAAPSALKKKTKKGRSLLSYLTAGFPVLQKGSKGAFGCAGEPPVVSSTPATCAMTSDQPSADVTMTPNSAVPTIDVIQKALADVSTTTQPDPKAAHDDKATWLAALMEAQQVAPDAQLVSLMAQAGLADVPSQGANLAPELTTSQWQLGLDKSGDADPGEASPPMETAPVAAFFPFEELTDLEMDSHPDGHNAPAEPKNEGRKEEDEDDDPFAIPPLAMAKSITTCSGAASSDMVSPAWLPSPGFLISPSYFFH